MSNQIIHATGIHIPHLCTFKINTLLSMKFFLAIAVKKERTRENIDGQREISKFCYWLVWKAKNKKKQWHIKPSCVAFLQFIVSIRTHAECYNDVEHFECEDNVWDNFIIYYYDYFYIFYTLHYNDYNT